MRRITIWVMSTISGLVLLLSYRTSTSGPLPTATDATTGAASPGEVAEAGTGAVAATAAPASPATSAPGSHATTSTTRRAASGTATSTTGAVASTRWGPVQVRVTVAGGRLTDVTVLQQPDANDRDVRINAAALPRLRQEALAAQSAAIDVVSGATITSQGYIRSLQSALDAAHLGELTLPGPPLRRSWVEHHLSTAVSIHVRGPDVDGPRVAAAVAAAYADLAWVEDVFSTFRPTSEVSRIDAGTLAVADAHPAVREVLALCERASAETDGAFAAWRPGPDGRRRLDPAGLVKGWAVARAGAPLRALGDHDHLVSVGGDVDLRAVVGPAWRVGVEDPADPSRPLVTVTIGDGGVATSGPARRGAHLVDPRTGCPATGVASITVVGASILWADVWATAAAVMGPEAGHRWLLDRQDVEHLLVDDAGRVRSSRGFAGLLLSP